MAHSRLPAIMADAAHAILCRPSRSCTGNFFIDDAVLQEEGITDFRPYQVDPELTRTLPPRFRAYSGMVAFFHAVGALLGTSWQPAGDLMALEAIQIISRFLAGAVTDDRDPNARTMLSWAGTAAVRTSAASSVKPWCRRCAKGMANS